MNSSFFNTLFQDFIGEYTPFENSYSISGTGTAAGDMSFSLTQTGTYLAEDGSIALTGSGTLSPVEGVTSALGNSQFELVNSIGCIDIAFIAGVITCAALFYFVFAALRVVFSR